jgi:nucleoside-triphosphatase
VPSRATRPSAGGFRAAPRVLLLTGPPGCGKTTVIRAVATRLAGRRLGGFYTEEIREKRQRQGFRLVPFGGASVVMAHVDRPGAPRVGRYGVDVRAIDRAAGQALAISPRVEVYLIDEIGKMECLSAAFVALVRSLLEAETPLVASVGRQGPGLIAEVKQRHDVEIWEVTRDNRDAMPDRVLVWLEAIRSQAR